MKKSILLTTFLVILTLVACTPTKPQMTPAAADTEAPSGADSDAPPTEAPTDTAVVLPADTPTVEPSPMPDPRVITNQPREIILSVEELAVVGDYWVYGSVPNYKEYQSMTNPYANLACTMGNEGALDFLEETGLVTGWTTQYNLPDDTPPLPRFIEFTVMVFQTIEGPKIFMEAWDSPCEFGFYDFIGELNIGDQSTLCRYEMYLTNGDLSHIRYRLAARYKNILLAMKVEEPEEGKIDLNMFFNVAVLQMEKIAGLMLEDEVTLDQDFTTGVGCSVPPTPIIPREGNNAGGEKIKLGVCVPTRVGDGSIVCSTDCNPVCPATTPEGEPLYGDCIPCVLDPSWY